MILSEPVIQETAASSQVAPVLVVSCGSAATEIARLLPEHYPVISRAMEGPTDVLAREIAADIARQFESGSQPALPAMLLIASTHDADRIQELLIALRETDLTTRPRVWPAFVDGMVDALTDFDAALDEANSGCDVVLMLSGAPKPGDAAAALGAWLHVKVPAPPSVLAQLPDSEGRVCRYVAVGAAQILRAEPPAVELGVEFRLTNAAVAAASSQIAAAVRTGVEELSAVAAARQQVTKLEAAAFATDPSAILAADRSLSEAIATMRAQLPRELAEMISEKIGEAVKMLSASGEVTKTDSPAPAATPKSEVDRTQALSALVLLASKGGLSKVFGRAKLSAASAALVEAAQAEVAATVAELCQSAQASIPSMLDAAIDAHRAELAAKLEAAHASAQQTAESDWQQSMEQAKTTTSIWPTIDTDGIRRSWGGPVPPPRRYLVGSQTVAGQLQDSEGTLAVVDLRDDDKRAVLLVAQYGLPLAALK